MADDFDQESKTETATPRRREQAYEQGQFAISAELSSGVVVFVGVGALAMVAHAFGDGLLAHTRNGLTTMPTSEMPMDVVHGLFNGMFGRGLALTGLLFGLVFAAALAVNLAQVGFRLNLERVSMDWERLSPFHFDRLLSWSKVMRGLILLLKVTAVGTVAWWTLRNRSGEIAQLGDTSLMAAVASSWTVLIRLALSMAGTLFVIGVLDYGWQLWSFERSINMTKQEIKDELKREEGDPQIRGRIRRMQRETAQRKMIREVPKATVIVTNPTHLAIALRYEPGKMSAPKVVAKGAGHIAKRIVALARLHGVPVLERKSLAQTLFKTVRVDKEVPMGLFLVVAEVLAHVYRLKGGMPPPAAEEKLDR
jgi:flagellar biosynthetic protein FlhB